MFPRDTIRRSKDIFRWFERSVIALLFLATVAGAQSVQTIDSEAQLASMMCRNPAPEATNELLNKNPQFVNVTLWNAVVDCASSLQRQGSPARSVEIYKLNLRVADRLKRPELAATTYYHLGRMYSVMNDFDNGIQAYETSRKLFEQTGFERDLTNVIADLGALYLIAEDYENALRYSEQGVTMAAKLNSNSTQESPGSIEYGRARSLHTLGQIDLTRGNHAEALKKFREALSFFERLNSTDSSYSIQTAEVLIGLAKVYGEMGQYGRALSSLSKAHQVSRSSGDQNTRANIMSSQASILLEQEDYVKAQTYFKASLEIYRNEGNARQEARVLLNLAVIEQRQGRNDEALEIFQRTIQRANSARLIDVQIAAAEGVGVVLTAKRDFPSALQTIHQSLEVARRVNAKTREVELLWRAAQTHYAMQNYSESAALAEEALTLARTLRLRKLTYFATATLGEAYAAQHKVDLAITTLKDAVNQIEELRDEVAAAHEGRLLFFENKVEPYRTLVKLLTTQGKNFEALFYAERAKGRVLLEAVRNNRSDLKDIYTDSEKAEAESLIDRYHAINQRIKSETSGEPDKELANELNAVRRELVVFQERLAVAHPELPVRAGPAKPLTQAELNTLVPATDFAYLEYVVTGDNVGLFILKGNRVTVDAQLKYLELEVKADELRRKVNEFHSALAERQPDYVPLGRELYRLLVEPAINELQNTSTLCIIPDEFLWTLPFQALTTTHGGYLIKERSVFYAPSLSVLKELTLRKRRQSSKQSFVAFGNPVIAKDEKLKQDFHPLPESEAEVAAVARVARFPLTKVLLGTQAEEKAFKTLAPQYATIHLATHGVLDNREPLNSYLLLTKTDGDPENDGLLQAREIVDLDLDADLAVLSACETGNGRVSPGEGVVGMSWAFLVAGARSVLVSQWRVNSASTSQLMKNFYEAMAPQKDLDGRNKSEALREASLRLLQDRRYRHPFYWAGFVLVSTN